MDKKQYQYGDCIPESRKIYEYLKQKGYEPLMVEGWVEVDIYNAYDVLPDKLGLKLFYSIDYQRIFKENNEYSDYPRLLPHTWVEVNNHIIDITKNQFNIYRGIKKYLIYEKYIISNFGFRNKYE